MFLSLSPSPHCYFLPSSSSSLLSQFPVFSASIAAALPHSHSHASQSAIKRISDKLRHLGHLQSPPHPQLDSEERFSRGSPGEIFIPTPHHLPTYNHRVGSTIDASPPPLTTKFNHKQDDMHIIPDTNKETLPSVAELTLPPHQLRRLRTLGIRLKQKLRVGKPGITEGIVNGIHERWKRSEVVKIKCDDLCRINMKRTHEILERKTGGLVVWRSGSIIILYRGSDYKYPYFRLPYQVATDSNVSTGSNNTPAQPALVPGVGSRSLVRLQLPGEAKLAEEADRLLDGLGPRFLDWWGLDPKPVDGDLLPGVVIGFRKPFRVLPFGIKQGLTDAEMTTLRRLGRPLPCHFALGRNRSLQGLAQAMIKLWEKCEIAKIAIKRGVQNANADVMVEELKKLTGGTLLSRDSECIVFYRGKDFLPLAVSTAIEERRKNGYNTAKAQEESHEERKFSHEEESCEERKFSDSKSVNKEMNFSKKDDEQMDSMGINKLEAKLSLDFSTKQSNLIDGYSKVMMKKKKAEKLLEKLENASEPPREEHEKEAISEEERYMLRKVGLRMKPFLLMGRKGVFDGTVENMHLHWKYRELVKIISKEKDIKEVEREAHILESESGGILVSVERVSKGYTIIIYRGKNYRRPKTLRPKSLLSKREAMKRSLEAQRHQSLKLHVLSLSRNIEKLKQLMNKDEPPSSHSIQKSTDCMEDSEGPTSSGNNDVEASQDNSEDMLILKDSIETACEAPSLTTGEEVLVANSKLATKIQPTEMQPGTDVCSTSGTNSHEKEILDEAGTDQIPSKAAPLSNKERLVLRKQALKMRKRPVLAVGRNNVITGVAKTIKTHFQKHPLAIVNIKNRADGTSVQQLICELEEATGSVLVSREPNKVILYRGWTERDNPGDKKKEDDPTKSSRGENGDTISLELIEAIRTECGFHPSKEEE